MTTVSFVAGVVSELAYSPQYGSAKDPINMAGFVAAAGIPMYPLYYSYRAWIVTDIGDKSRDR